jgi:hypothetical protein
MIKNNINFSKITEAVKAENKKWNGKKETDPAISSTLIKYWKGLVNVTAKQMQSSSYQEGLPWSAAYISWIAKQADPSFPSSSAHRNYAASGLRNRNKAKNNSWKLYSLSREQQPILCQVGDILVGGRGGKYENSHGDIVWSVKPSEKIAYLAGGNVSNTNKIYIKINLNNDLTYDAVKVGKYLTVMKKMS